MLESTRKTWAEQDRHEGDHTRMFTAVSTAADATSVLYPGSWVDIAASVVFDDVTYVDTDRRAKRFFDDAEGVDELICELAPKRGEARKWSFIAQDYTSELEVGKESFDMLVSLYAGPISQHCTVHLRLGGTLLANTSHGDAVLAALDDRYELSGVVLETEDAYRVELDELDRFLVPKGEMPTRQKVLESGRGVAFTRPAFAYLFRRTS